MTRGIRFATVFAVALSGTLVSGCNRWRPNSPVEITVKRSPPFARVLSIVRTLGYAVLEEDSKQWYLRVAAKTQKSSWTGAGWVSATGSWFGIQIYADGIVIRASGVLVSNDDTERYHSLDDEMSRLGDQLRAELAQ